MKPLLFVSLVMFLSLPAMAQTQSVVNSPHNLSASGGGAIRATSEQEICIFCHTPHNATPVQPLWNRNVPVSAYTVYSSSSLQASPGQPTGSSKLCLSCHDGTIALGSVVSRGQPIAMAGGMTTLPPGKSNLGTDLSDDHPISFKYDSQLVSKRPTLTQPSALPEQIKLDAKQELQCTTCHEAHDNSFGNFLVMDNTGSKLCVSCHATGTTTLTSHVQCASCHQSHSAPSGPYLLKGKTPSQTCVACHNGSTAGAANIGADLNKLSRHDTNSPADQPNHIPNDIACNDCHGSHTMKSGTASAPLVSPKLGDVAGVNSAGATVPKASYEYEVCFKCHADKARVQPMITRLAIQTNKRLQMDTGAISYHPVEAPGKNPNVPSLKPGWTVSSQMYCTDCHSSDAGKVAAGSGPDGPHGSNVAGLLVAGYETHDDTVESPSSYALCYRCHERSTVLSAQSFSQHQKHVVDQRTTCSTCHDSHGIASAQGTVINNANLINFNISIVKPDPVTGRLEYRSLGAGRGQCFLQCHGKAHSPADY